MPAVGATYPVNKKTELDFYNSKAEPSVQAMAIVQGEAGPSRHLATADGDGLLSSGIVGLAPTHA